MAWVFIREQQEDTGTHREKIPLSCDDGDRDRDVQGTLGPPVAGRDKEGSFPRGFRESMALSTLWLWTSNLPKCRRINFLSKPPSLWHFAVAATKVLLLHLQSVLFTTCANQQYAVLASFTQHYLTLSSSLAHVPRCLIPKFICRFLTVLPPYCSFCEKLLLRSQLSNS